MIILGIETSCDETAAAVVEDGRRILSNIVATSADLHVKTGGIIPEQAARQQLKSLLPVINEAIKQAKSSPEKIDAIAVTQGPGLIGSLLVGVETTKALSYLWQKPLIPINHLVAHLYANWFSKGLPKFPMIGLVVSGGHSDLVYVKGDYGKMELIGTTRDDAAGECFDKCARLLGLPYPGGPSISTAADKFINENPERKLVFFPRPLTGQENYDFSFSGLKTAVLNEVKNKRLSEEEVNKYAAEVQEAIVDSLVEKTLRAVRKYKPRSLLLGGGVSANLRLRQKFDLKIRSEKLKINLMIPEAKFCTDNAAVIASCAFFNNRSVAWEQVSASPELTIVS